MRRIALRPALTVSLLLVALLLAACTVERNQPPADDEPPVGERPVETPAQPVQLSVTDSTTSFELENTSEDTLDWHFEIENDADNPSSGQWFDVRPEEGVLGPHERAVVVLSLRDDLPEGTYRSILTVVYPGGTTPFEVVGEVGDEGSEIGTGRIRGEVTTENALIPIDPPSSGGVFLSTGTAHSSESTGGAGSRSDAVSGDGQASGDATAAAADAPGSEASALPEFHPHQLVIDLAAGLSTLSAGEQVGALEELLAAGAIAGYELTSAGLVVQLHPGSDPSQIATQLSDDPRVASAEPNRLFRLHALNDPYIDRAWQLPVVGAPVAWQVTSGTKPIVAVIDSGFDLDHPDLQGIFLAGYDFCASSDCMSTDSDPRPGSTGNPHGTHVVGLLAAVGDNGRGTSGVVASGARIVPIKVQHGSIITASALTDAIRWAAGAPVPGAPSNPNPADIIALSIGAEADDPDVKAAIDDANSRGALVIASAGNDGTETVDYPARYSNVVGVGSVNSRLRRSCFSDWGPGLDLMAPGGDGVRCTADNELLLSTSPGNDYATDAGTSMAAPLVAGAAALVWSDMTSPTAQRVRDRLLSTAYFDPSFMDEEGYGAGVARVDRALGLPGPGDSVAVQAVGPTVKNETVTLDPWGGSEEFSLDDLAAGTYELVAEAAGTSREMSAEATVELADGEVESRELQLNP